MSLTAIIYRQIEHISNWTSSTLNNILTIGNNLYISIRYFVQTNDYLLLTAVPCIVSLYNKVYSLQYSELLTGSLFMMSNNGPYMTLQNSLIETFSSSRLNYNCCSTEIPQKYALRTYFFFMLIIILNRLIFKQKLF